MRPTCLRTPTGTRIEVHLGPDDWARAIRSDTVTGLAGEPKEIPPTWFYDERGCELFEAITRLPEYYPTRTERAILAERADEIAELTGADTLVELGAGTSEKTRLLLDALAAAGLLRRFVPFDVAEATLIATAEAIADEHPDIEVVGVVGDFRRHLGELPARAGGSSPSWAAPSATCGPASGPSCSASWPPRWGRATASCSAPTW